MADSPVSIPSAWQDLLRKVFPDPEMLAFFERVLAREWHLEQRHPEVSTDFEKLLDMPFFQPMSQQAQNLRDVIAALQELGDDAFVREALLEHMRSVRPLMLTCTEVKGDGES